MDVGLSDAWRMWSSGDLDGGDQLWGVSILWWGRIGKLAEFVAALTIVAEIIGPEKIKGFGKAVRHLSTEAIGKRTLRDAAGWTKALLLYLGTGFSKESTEARAQMEAFFTYKVFAVLTIATAVFGGYLGFRVFDSWVGIFGFAP